MRSQDTPGSTRFRAPAAPCLQTLGDAHGLNGVSAEQSLLAAPGQQLVGLPWSPIGQTGKKRSTSESKGQLENIPNFRTLDLPAIFIPPSLFHLNS